MSIGLWKERIKEKKVRKNTIPKRSISELTKAIEKNRASFWLYEQIERNYIKYIILKSFLRDMNSFWDCVLFFYEQIF